jgi:hypothetical protein
MIAIARARHVIQHDPALVAQVASILASTRPTAFALEGRVVEALRRQWCNEGRSFIEADAAARGIVRQALEHIGVSRPSGAELQRSARIAASSRWKRSAMTTARRRSAATRF